MSSDALLFLLSRLILSVHQVLLLLFNNYARKYSSNNGKIFLTEMANKLVTLAIYLLKQIAT